MPSIAEQIEAIKKKLEKEYKDTTELFPDFLRIKEIDVIKHRSAIVNAVTGVGGLPRGRVVELWGPEGSGKTTFAIESVASLQEMDPNGVAAYVDFEHAFDPAYARMLRMSLDPNKFIFMQPEYFEQGAVAIGQFVDADLLDLIVIDSAAAMTPRDMLNGSLEDTPALGMHSRLMSRFLEIITKKIARGRRPNLLIINQTRMKIDVKNSRNTGEDAAGGKAIKFYASIRLKLEEVKLDGEGARGATGGADADQQFTRKRIRITAVKNKVAPPFLRGQFIIDFGQGINNLESIADLAESKLGIVGGAGYVRYIGDTPTTSLSCRGRDSLRDEMKLRPDLFKEIERKVLAFIREEQAKALGITEIIVSGKAKVIENDDNEELTLSTLSPQQRVIDTVVGLPPNNRTTVPAVPVKAIKVLGPQGSGDMTFEDLE